ncbi:MAG: pyruvate, phosphate dikinase [Trueperaceae bacterium]|nr:pyruvate, phosphate dikinase [Trueperaceae bacterium]
MSDSVKDSTAAPDAADAVWVYGFDQLDQVEATLPPGDWEGVRGLLGGKGANLFEMTRLGVPVPPGFTVTTAACNAYLDHDRNFPDGMWDQELAALERVETVTGKVFGDPHKPLLVSCRSGSKFSMPGMMDTVLNIGLNDTTAEAMVKDTGDERFVFDAYRRLVQMFGCVVMGIDDEPFEEVIAEEKEARGLKLDVELDAAAWRRVTERFKGLYRAFTGSDFPQDPLKQLELATRAVFNSWFGKRAVDYRNATGIRHDLGTAVNIQTVVFGNMGVGSGTGVAFTRNPNTGEKVLYGDYLMNAQGEDVVAGIRNTEPISQLKSEMPQVYQEFVDICDRLEARFSDMQDVEFTIERGKLWMLQTRNGKRTARAAIQIAVDLAGEGLIDQREALLRVTPDQVDQLLHPQFTEATRKDAVVAGKRLVEKAVNASPGAAVGRAVFDADTAEKWAANGEAVIMVRPETKPDDVHGMIASKGILTSRGGATSHAAVVARQFGTPAVCGAETLKIDVERKAMSIATSEGPVYVREGDWISLDGATGEVFLGQLPTHEPDVAKEEALATLLGWADQHRKLGVWANADYPADAKRARTFGAEGIGLCRTEHMFFEEARLPLVQSMIMADTEERRAAALDFLLPLQRSDFEGLFEAMEGRPVIIRLLDPPLHEFLPAYDDLQQDLTDLKVRIQHATSLTEIDEALAEVRRKEDLLARVSDLRESNPMLGLRGVRLGVIYPEISAMQVRAILEAAANVIRRGTPAHPEIMIPLTSDLGELAVMRKIVDEVAAKVQEEMGNGIDFKFGTMIEIPRAALTAGTLAETAEFFSFGTNDLTQTTYGISRDDAEGKFLMQYVEQGVIASNPFQHLDPDGVGQLVRHAVEHGRKTRPDLHVGICGEHGGDPKSIALCHDIGLDYVSCSPFRVPVARLAAAQAAIQSPEA